MSGHKKYDIEKANKRLQACLMELGFWGVLLAPQQVQGRALVGLGAKPSEARDFILQMT